MNCPRRTVGLLRFSVASCETSGKCPTPLGFMGKIIIMPSSDVVLLLGLNDIKEEKHTVPGTG